MHIREAYEQESDDILDFYHKMCEELKTADFLPKSYKGGVPSKTMVWEAIRRRELYVGHVDDQIVAAYIMNHESDAAYDTVKWQITPDPQYVSVLHSLRVAPAYSGRGYGSRLVEHAIMTAEKKGQQVIRLDCIEGNEVPHKMYRSHGFRYIDTVEICYEDVGVPWKFLLYEKVIG